MQDTWTIFRMLSWMEGYLTAHGDTSARVSSQLLVSHATGLGKTQLYLDMQRPLISSELDWLRGAVKRRAAGEPIQYITGMAPFRFLELTTAPGVLIPRPETEVLVSVVLNHLPKPTKILATDSKINEYGEPMEEMFEEGGVDGSAASQKILAADLCTGSGCVACSLATEHADVEVYATDISDAAVELACLNAERCGAGGRIRIYKCDLGEALPKDVLGNLDVVVSNPPYVPTSVLGKIPSEVSDFEPALALDGGDDGLDIFRRIVDFAGVALKPNGFIACELFEDSMGEAIKILREGGFCDIGVERDLAGKPRVVYANKNNSDQE